jgi:hypothetical protein
MWKSRIFLVQYFCLIMKGSGAGSILVTKGSGCGSGSATLALWHKIHGIDDNNNVQINFIIASKKCSLEAVGIEIFLGAGSAVIWIYILQSELLHSRPV